MNKKKIDFFTLKRLLKLLFRNYKKQLIIVLICIIIGSIATISGTLFMRSLIDDYIAPLLLKSNPVYTELLKAILNIAVIYILGIMASFFYNRTMVTVSQGFLKDIRDTMFSNMQSFEIRYFDTNIHGDIMSHYTNDTDTLRDMISQGLPEITSSLINIMIVFISMMCLNVKLTIFVMIFLLIMLKVTKMITKKASKYYSEQQKVLGKVNGYIEEMINGQKVIKVFTREKQTKEGFDKVNDELYQNMRKANSYSNILMPILNNLGNLVYVIVAVVGAVLALSGINSSITVGTIVSFITLTKGLTQPLSQISTEYNNVIMSLAGAKRIFELMDNKPEEDNGTVTLVNAIKSDDGKLIETEEKSSLFAWKNKNGELVELKGYVEFKNVNFSYSTEPVLKDISLYAKSGQKIAFVGATGAGKTTITNLINRFYDINEGEILYDGINIKDIKKKDLRTSLGMVLQDTNLFTGTIKDNIRYIKKDATDEEIINAAKIANAHSFIENLPQGYDTMIDGKGENLSQGQRQLISIARVTLNNPPVMILDEATSSIDTRTEKAVQEGMDKLMEGRTVFVIAHRLSTIRNSKAIIVMDHGRIIERGNHKDLIAKKGQYYMLYTGATELE